MSISLFYHYDFVFVELSVLCLTELRLLCTGVNFYPVELLLMFHCTIFCLCLNHAIKSFIWLPLIVTFYVNFDFPLI